MSSNVILQFSAHFKVQRLETVTVFLRLNGRLPASGLGTLQTQPRYNRTHTNSVQQIAIAITEDPSSRQPYSASSGSDEAKGLHLRNGSKYVNQSAADSRQGIIKTVFVTVLVTKYKTGRILARPKQRTWGMALVLWSVRNLCRTGSLKTLAR